MKIRLLGPVDVLTADGVAALGPPKQRAALAALAVDVGRVVPADTLVTRIWGDPAPDRAHRTLHTYIAKTRRLIKEASAPSGVSVAVARSAGGYALQVDPGRVDLWRFRDLVSQATGGDVTTQQRIGLIGAAMGLWYGTPLAGVTGEWADRTREGLHRQYADAVTVWADGKRSLGEALETTGRLAELIEQHPLNESLVAALMQALHAGGRSAEALERYAVIQRRLADELGVNPGPYLQQLHRAILRNELPSALRFGPSSAAACRGPETPAPSRAGATATRRRWLVRPRS
jgi:DNA-binding SARP family transcriptional activator